MALHIALTARQDARPLGGEAKARPRRRPETWALRLCFAFAFALLLCVRVSIWLGRDLLFEAGPSKQALA